MGEISGGFSADDVVLMVAISAGAAIPGRVTRGVAQDAGHALRDAAKNLVAERPRPAREIVDGDHFAAVAADERDRGAQSGVRLRHVGDVDHQHVHAHGADDRERGGRRPAHRRRARAVDSRRHSRAEVWRRETGARRATDRHN